MTNPTQSKPPAIEPVGPLAALKAKIARLVQAMMELRGDPEAAGLLTEKICQAIDEEAAPVSVERGAGVATCPKCGSIGVFTSIRTDLFPHELTVRCADCKVVFPIRDMADFWQFFGPVEPASGRPEVVNSLPEHLREDAPFVQCDQCGRKSWSKGDLNQTCGMTQPDKSKCSGVFRASGRPEVKP